MKDKLSEQPEGPTGPPPGSPERPGQSPAARSQQAETTARELDEIDLVKIRETRHIRKVMASAGKEVRRMFKAASVRINTNRGEFTEANLIYILFYPLDKLEEEWIGRVREIRADGGDKEEVIDLREEYGSFKKNNTGTGRVTEIVETIRAYLDRMRQEDGWITPEKMAEIAYSTSREAVVIANLLAAKDNEDLILAFQWAVGKKGQDAEAAAKDALKKRAPEIFKMDLKLQKAVWMILSFTDRSTRLEIGRYVRDRNPSAFEKFLEQGNAMGVYSPDEIVTITGSAIDAKKRETMALRWRAANDFSKEAKRLSGSSYGSRNRAAEMLTGRNMLLFIGQLAAGATIGANFVVGVTKGGAWKDPAKMVQLLTNHNIIAGTAVIGAIHHVKKGKKWGQTFMGKEKRETYARRQAYETLNETVRGRPDLHEFFRVDGHIGAAVFADFINSYKSKKGEFPESLFTAAMFKDYLELQSDSDNPDRENTDYAAILKRFDRGVSKIDDKTILVIAKAFDALKIGGAEIAKSYDNEVHFALYGEPSINPTNT